MLEHFQLVLEFLNLVIDEARSSNPSSFHMTSFCSVIFQPISYISLIKASIEVITKIASVTFVGMTFSMLVQIVWFIIHTKTTRHLGMLARMSLGMTLFCTLAVVLSVSSMMAS